MWIIMNDSFLSVVEDRHDDSVLVVRARVDGDIERIFPDAAVVEMSDADYRYRAFIDRSEVARAMFDSVNKINYDKFKPSVTDDKRHDVYLSTWQSLYALQEDQDGEEVA